MGKALTVARVEDAARLLPGSGLSRGRLIEGVLFVMAPGGKLVCGPDAKHLTRFWAGEPDRKKHH